MALSIFIVGPSPAPPLRLYKALESKAMVAVGRAHSLTEAVRQIRLLAPDFIVITGKFSAAAIRSFFSEMHRTDSSERAFSVLIQTDSDRPHLSRRESETLVELARGFSTKEIADHLGIGCRTVETYRSSLKQKLHAVGSADLAIRAVELGYLETRCIPY